MKSSWRDFRKVTTINGIPEFDGMKAPLLKAAWVCVCVVVAICCAILMSDIVHAFAEQTPATSVGLVSSMTMPPLAIRFGYDIKRILEKLATADIHDIKYAVIAQAWYRLPCPAAEMLTYPMAFSDSWVNLTQLDNVYHGSPELVRFTKEYAALIPPLEYYTKDSGARFVTPGDLAGHSTPRWSQLPVKKPRLTTFGPIMEFDMHNIFTNQMEEINILLNISYDYYYGYRDAETFDDYAILVGHEVSTAGPVEGRVLQPGVNYSLSLQLREVSYSKNFCDGSYSRFGCRVACAIKEAKLNNNTCVPYLGDDREAAGTRVCSGSFSDRKISHIAEGNVKKVEEQEEEFRKLEIFPKPGFTQFKHIKRGTRADLERQEPRWRRISPVQKWSDIWPTATTFKASVVPLPVRMGYQRKWWKKPPPHRHGNLELMKIPNFLHLTPNAIKEQCEAIKKFTTPWPKELANEEIIDHHFPLEFAYSDYVHAGQSIRDPRARITNLCVSLSSLSLDEHAHDKFLRLVTAKRYDAKRDEVNILTDRCPTRKQNQDYAIYLLTALSMEARKFEEWEKEKTYDDMEKFTWEGSKAQENAHAYVARVRELYARRKVSTQTNLPQQTPESVATPDPGTPSQTTDSQPLVNPTTPPSLPRYASTEDTPVLPEVKRLATAWTEYRNGDETEHLIGRYGEAVRALLGLPGQMGGLR